MKARPDLGPGLIDALHISIHVIYSQTYDFASHVSAYPTKKHSKLLANFAVRARISRLTAQTCLTASKAS